MAKRPSGKAGSPAGQSRLLRLAVVAPISTTTSWAMPPVAACSWAARSWAAGSCSFPGW